MTEPITPEPTPEPQPARPDPTAPVLIHAKGSAPSGPDPIYLVHLSIVRHIGPAEYHWLRSAGVEVLVETDKDTHRRLLAEARVRQGYLQA
jgi:hypothetical protein